MIKKIVIVSGLISLAAIGYAAYEMCEFARKIDQIQAETDRIIAETKKVDDDYLHMQQEIHERLNHFAKTWGELNSRANQTDKD